MPLFGLPVGTGRPLYVNYLFLRRCEKIVGGRRKIFWVGKGGWFSYFEFVKGKVFVKKKLGVLDPEGATIQKALLNLGYKQIGAVRSGRVFEVELEAKNPKEAEEKLLEMARKLLANPVIEEFRVELENGAGK